jgi:chromosome segregation ATPase
LHTVILDGSTNHFSHSSRLENISKAQAEISADGNPLEQRLKGSIAKIAHDLGDAQTLQARNETLLSQNAKLEQQFEHVNEQVADLLKERVALTSIRSSLEQQVQKSAEDLAGLRERLMGVAKTPNIQESLQVGLLQTENFNLKQEAEQLRQKCEKSNDSSGELSRLIETLKVFVADDYVKTSSD